MRSFGPLILSLIGTATTGFAARPSSADSSVVVSLTKETFYDYMEEHPLVLANFYAPWCRWSKDLAPKFEVAAEELRQENIPLVKIDCTQEEDLCAEFKIPGYPTMKVFRGPESHEPYGGSRHPESIISYMIDESVSSDDGSVFHIQSDY
ncbi:thioredoxin-like protein [Aspergillus bertholletiae]|uniref:Protein disulfide-isomerase n=1 Tax=Aspergillus bertholletiae TaxID=1226010 RepID=A0A5N7BME9_9EURO|nr:thioredoxin-like protein [Aspergillus bertholletiae]